MENEPSGRDPAAAAALGRLAAEIGRVEGLDDEWTSRRDEVAALVDVVAARLTSPAEEVLVVFVGSTGSGKSTLLNALFGESITEAGIKRPTTLAPLVVTHPARASQHRIAGIGGVEEARVVTRDVALTRHLTFVDSPDPDSVAPGHASMARALANAADLLVPVTTPSRYADAIPWDLFARRWRVGIPSLPVMNRIRADRDGRMQVGHLVARAAMAGLPLETEEVLRIPERPGIGILTEDVAELADVLIEVGSEDRNQTVGQARRGAAVDGLGAARRFVDDVEELEAGLRRTKRMTEAAWQAKRTTLAEELERTPVGVGVHATVLLDLTDPTAAAGQADRLVHAAAVELSSRADIGDAEAVVRRAASRAGAGDDAGITALLLATGPEPPAWASSAFDTSAVEVFVAGLVDAVGLEESADAPTVPTTLRGALLEARRALG